MSIGATTQPLTLAVGDLRPPATTGELERHRVRSVRRPTAQRVRCETPEAVREARMQVPTPTYFSSGRHATVERAMAALSDAVEHGLQEDLANGMVPIVEQMSVALSTEDDAPAATHTAVALVLIRYQRID